ncbi:MAG: ABC transporter substrate-binding protein [Pseudomonadota bacterium]
MVSANWKIKAQKLVLSGIVWIFLVCPLSLSAKEQEIILGAATSLTYLEGRESLNAAAMAVEEINARGGVTVGGKALRFRIESADLRDAEPGDPVTLAVSRFESFIREKKIQAVIIGPYRSEVLLPCLDIIAAHRIPLLGTIAMTPASEKKTLQDPKYRYAFRIGLNSSYLVEYLIRTMKFLNQGYGFRNLSVMIQDVAWTRTTASLVLRLYVDRSDWRMLGMKTYPTGNADFMDELVQAGKDKAQVILALFDMPESALLVKQWHRMENKALLFGFVSPMLGADAWQSFEGKIAGAMNAEFELGNIPSPKWEPSMRFHQAYKKKYGQDIQSGHGPAPSYESVYILADAIERAGSLDPDRIVSALEATDRIGAMGRMRFGRGHQIIFGCDPTQESLACIVQWQSNGSRRVIYPLEIADGEIELPGAGR